MTSYQIGVIWGAIITGALIGLIFLILALRKGRRKLAIIGFVSCIVANFVLGLFLSIPVFIILCLVLYLGKTKTQQGETRAK
jgi:MFS family permease